MSTCTINYRIRKPQKADSTNFLHPQDQQPVLIRKETCDGYHGEAQKVGEIELWYT
jgi:hypothetical protein